MKRLHKPTLSLSSLIAYLTLAQTVMAQGEITIKPVGTFGNTSEAAKTIVELVLFAGGIACFAYIIYGGYKYVTAGANAENTAAARRTILNAVIGFLLLSLSFVIWQVVVKVIGIQSLFGL